MSVHLAVVCYVSRLTNSMRQLGQSTLGALENAPFFFAGITSNHLIVKTIIIYTLRINASCAYGIRPNQRQIRVRYLAGSVS